MQRKAIVIGATGLIGKQLVELLLNSNDFDLVSIYVRRALNIKHEKLEEIVFDFENLDSIHNSLNGTDLFICLGTTIKVAGSKNQFYKVDHDLPLNFAKLAKEKGIENVYLVSSMRSNSKSSNFYLQTKGKLEEDLAALNFKKFIVFRPSMLLGNRTENRTGEKIGQLIMTKLDFLLSGPLKNYKAIDSKKVAASMVAWCMKDYNGFRVISSGEMQ